MATLLHLDSSPMGEDSISRRLTHEFVLNWLRANPRGKVITRDLTVTTVPVLSAAWDTANRTPKELRTPEQNELLSLSTIFTRELLQADEYVFGIPMHNLGPATKFKLWLDHIVRFGVTICASPSGPKGTLGKKRAAFIIAAGGDYGRSSGNGNASLNFLEPWLRAMFGYLGVENMQFIFVDGTAKVKAGECDREAFLWPHIEAIRTRFSETLCLQQIE
jgi:FMN-dependent NADH-azoreductase